MRRILLGMALSLMAVVTAGQARAQTPITIKLGTLAPAGSSWHRLLKQMGEEWKTASNGAVKLTIFAGGTAGDEGDTIRKMKTGQLQASALTSLGLQSIEPSPQAISTPGMIANDGEWKYVFAKMQPIWEQRILAKGYVPLMWGDTGWAYNFFTTEKRTPSAAKGTKMFVWAGDPKAVRSWAAAGFEPVVLSATDIMTSLNTGMIEGVANTPVMAFSARFFEKAKYMPDYRWCHLPAVTVMTKKAWDSIPADLQPKLMEIAKKYADKVNSASTKMDADALSQMQKAGLQVIKLTPAEKKEWDEAAAKIWPTVRGGVVPAAQFDEVKKFRDAYRAGAR